MSAPPLLGLPARFTGVIVSPRETFEEVERDPRSLGILVVSIAVVAIISAAFLSAEVGRRALGEQQVRGMESFGIITTDEQYAQFEELAPYAVYVQLGSLVAGVPLVTVTLAGVLCVVAYGFLGGRAAFKQVFAVVAHAGAIFVVQQAFVAPLNYARGAMSNTATLAAFVPMLDEETFVVRLLSTFDVFFLWWVMLLAIDVAAVSERRTAPIAI